MFSAFRATVLAAVIAGFALPVQAAYVVTFQEVGLDVVASGSGTIDVADLVPLCFPENPDGPGCVAAPEMVPRTATIITGTVSEGSQIQLYSGITGPTSFGSGGSGSAIFPDTGSGDIVGVIGALIQCATREVCSVVPEGYVSGSLLSASSTYSNQTFSSLGVTPGTYIWTWGTGANADSLTLQIGPVATTPEPASLTLLAVGLAGLGVVLRSRRV